MTDQPVEETPVAPEVPKIVTAFVVAIDEAGRVYLERNISAVSAEMNVEREATFIEIRRYISEILMDLQAQASAEYTINALMQAQQPITTENLPEN